MHLLHSSTCAMESIRATLQNIKHNIPCEKHHIIDELCALLGKNMNENTYEELEKKFSELKIDSFDYDTHQKLIKIRQSFFINFVIKKQSCRPKCKTQFGSNFVY